MLRNAEFDLIEKRMIGLVTDEHDLGWRFGLAEGVAGKGREEEAANHVSAIMFVFIENSCHQELRT